LQQLCDSVAISTPRAEKTAASGPYRQNVSSQSNETE
jgi:hypothetical protein